MPRYGQLAGPRSRSVFNTPLFFTIFFRHLCLRTLKFIESVSFNPFGRGECACLAVATAGCKTEQESRQTEAATC